MRRVINATGVIIQTNLGRAPLSDRARRAMAGVAAGYSNLEFDLAAGARGSRHEHVRELIRATTGAEDGMAVNNNAAAVFMVLTAVRRGPRGARFPRRGRRDRRRLPHPRCPALRAAHGSSRSARPTAPTRHDYGHAWTPETAAILRVHPSNFRVTGFTARPELAELAQVAHVSGGLLLDDLGSGALIDTARFGLAHEPTPQEALAAGADLVMFSGDKLLGGPQCGIIAGRSRAPRKASSAPAGAGTARR